MTSLHIQHALLESIINMSLLYTSLSLLVVQILTQTTDNSQQQTHQNVAIVLGVLTGIALLLYWIDKKNGHAWSRELRGRIGDWIMRARNKKSYGTALNEKGEDGQNPTPRFTLLDQQKINAQLAEPEPEKPSQQAMLPQQIKSETPSADFKNVFEVKQSKSKHKQKNKSKSKLKSRLIGKGSDQEREDQVGEGASLTEENSELAEQNSGEKDASLTEQYNILEDDAVEQTS